MLGIRNQASCPKLPITTLWILIAITFIIGLLVEGLKLFELRIGRERSLGPEHACEEYTHWHWMGHQPYQRGTSFGPYINIWRVYNHKTASIHLCHRQIFAKYKENNKKIYLVIQWFMRHLKGIIIHYTIMSLLSNFWKCRLAHIMIKLLKYW